MREVSLGELGAVMICATSTCWERCEAPASSCWRAHIVSKINESLYRRMNVLGHLLKDSHCPEVRTLKLSKPSTPLSTRWLPVPQRRLAPSMPHFLVPTLKPVPLSPSSHLQGSMQKCMNPATLRSTLRFHAPTPGLDLVARLWHRQGQKGYFQCQRFLQQWGLRNGIRKTMKILITRSSCGKTHCERRRWHERRTPSAQAYL
jgi:hypothetical protein